MPKTVEDKASPVEEQAAAIVDEYALFLLEQSIADVNRQNHGEGCGCRTCRINAEQNLQWATEFVKGEKKTKHANS